MIALPKKPQDPFGMPTIFIPAQLRTLSGGASQVVVAGETVGQALEALDRLHPGIKSRLCENDGLRPGWQVSVNDVLTTRGLRAKLQPESEIHFLPAVGGG